MAVAKGDLATALRMTIDIVALNIGKGIDSVGQGLAPAREHGTSKLVPYGRDLPPFILDREDVWQRHPKTRRHTRSARRLDRNPPLCLESSIERCGRK